MQLDMHICSLACIYAQAINPHNFMESYLTRICSHQNQKCQLDPEFAIG